MAGCRLAESSFTVTHLVQIEWRAIAKYRKIRVHVKNNYKYTFIEIGLFKKQVLKYGQS